VDAHAMQPAWMRMRCSLRDLLNQLNQLNHHCLIQMIIVGSK